MSEELENLVWALLDEEQNIQGVAVLDGANQIVYQTENWDLTSDVSKILEVKEGKSSSVEIQGVRYMIVENVPERIIGTNVTGKGHLIMCPAGAGLLVTYIDPAAGPRDALFNVQAYSGKLAPHL